MAVNIKKEKLVNENLDDEFTVSNYMDSNHNPKFEVNKSILESEIAEMKKLISSLESEIISLKHSNNESTNIIAEKNKYLNIVYSTIDHLEVKENIPVINPKTAILKLNKYQATTKELHDQVVDNKIILMTLCRILGCSNTKIVQSLKDIINENENIKQKFKVYEQFYLRSAASLNQMSSDLHLNGYGKAISTVTDVNNACSFHTESFDNWNIKMANLRSKCLNKPEKINSKSTYNSKSEELNRQLQAKQQMAREDKFLQQNFYKNIPPPVPTFNYPPPLPLSIRPAPQNRCPIPRFPQYRNNPSCPIRPTNNTKSNNPKTKNKRPISNNYQTNSDLKPTEKENPDKTNVTTSFEINSNVFDWQNCTTQEAKEELSKLEKKMIEDLSTITSSSNVTRCVSPSISLVEDKSEIWDYDSDSNDGEIKRSKRGI